MNSASNIQQFDFRPQNNNSMLLPACGNPYGCVFSVKNAAKQFPGIFTKKSLPPLIPSQRPPEFDESEKRYLAFDQLRDGRSYVFFFFFFFSPSSIPYPFFNSVDLGLRLQGSTDTNVSNGQGGEEMHEDTEEIDALLYSDSDEDHDDEEASTGRSPVGVTGRSLASSMFPAKRRRVDVDEFDASSLVDTASSQVLHCPEVATDHRNKADGKHSSESSCVKGGDHHQNEDDVLHIKRARIQETVSILRRIIPGGGWEWEGRSHCP
ncbi:hypothetical protein GW17_00061364 [Ensete ventricosum]|nr:hypothetical protein GW17_00061364 [Ensete ventricosum]